MFTFPNGWTLKRAKEVLVGARVHTGAIRIGDSVRSTRWNESQITNVTAGALIVGMLTVHDRIVVVSPRRSSFLIESGRLRSHQDERFTVAIHPSEMGYLHRILGLPVLADEERAIAEDDAALAGAPLDGGAR